MIAGRATLTEPRISIPPIERMACYGGNTSEERRHLSHWVDPEDLSNQTAHYLTGLVLFQVLQYLLLNLMPLLKQTTN